MLTCSYYMHFMKIVLYYGTKTLIHDMLDFIIHQICIKLQLLFDEKKDGQKKKKYPSKVINIVRHQLFSNQDGRWELLCQTNDIKCSTLFNYLRYTQQICVKIHNKMYKRIYLEKRKIMFLKKIYNLIIVRREN